MTQRTFRSVSKSASKLALICAALSASTAFAAITADQARRIHDRLTGVPPSAAVLATMQSQDLIGAANTAMLNPAFYNAKLKNWITPWTNRDDDAFAPLNDFTATLIGLIRDGSDFRQALYGDVIYTGGAGIAAYSNGNNQHYIDLENSNVSLKDALVLKTQSSVTGLPAGATAGVITTRAAARAFFIDGTNRAMFRFTLRNMLCHDLETVHDTSRPADRIRQDVTRSPGNDSRLFLNGCIGCHSGMDPMAQSFAYYDFSYDKKAAAVAANPNAVKDAGHLVYGSSVLLNPDPDPQVKSKYYHDEQNFKPGFHTPNDHWTNNWRLGPNAAVFGWAGVADQRDGLVHGDGAKSMGQELANSDAFAECQVKKVFKAVCLRDPMESDRTNVVNGVSGFNGMLSDFKNGGNLKKTFAEAAAYCAD